VVHIQAYTEPNLFLLIYTIILSGIFMAYKYIDYIKARKKLAPYTSRLLARTLSEADKRIEKHSKFIKRLESAKISSIQNLKDLPKNATIRKEYIKCGKNGCELSHGPYYYAYWKEKVTSNDDTTAATWKLKKKYIGSFLPQNEGRAIAA
jgi:hypothetical protein